MPFKIQRVPRGLANLLSMFGGDGPTELEDRVRSTVELLQLYGLQQLQVASVANAAVAEGGTQIVTPSSGNWSVLFGAHANFTKTGTVTALRGEIYVNRVAGGPVCVASESLGPFGATETGGACVTYEPPYPKLCPPGTTIIASPTIIGTDANVVMSLLVEFGVLG